MIERKEIEIDDHELKKTKQTNEIRDLNLFFFSPTHAKIIQKNY